MIRLKQYLKESHIIVQYKSLWVSAHDIEKAVENLLQGKWSKDKKMKQIWQYGEDVYVLHVGHHRLIVDIINNKKTDKFSIAHKFDDDENFQGLRKKYTFVKLDPKKPYYGLEEIIPVSMLNKIEQAHAQL